MKSLLFLIIVVAGIAWFTVPSDEKIRKEAYEFISYKIPQTEIKVIDNLKESVIKSGIEIEDKLFYKNVRFKFDGKDEKLGWAAFGKVKLSHTSKD